MNTDVKVQPAIHGKRLKKNVLEFLKEQNCRITMTEKHILQFLT